MSWENVIRRWRIWAARLKVETHALYLACRDPRVPWYAKLFAALVVGYAFSPIDLIPDFIPVLGHVDDLILVPLGVALALRMIPGPVLAECRQSAQQLSQQGKPTNWIGAVLTIVLWLLIAALIILTLVT